MKCSLLGPAAQAPTLVDIPIFSDPVSAGFPSPAADYVEQSLDLNTLCVRRPASTFFVRVEGDSMIDAGILPNDILVVDRSVQEQHGNIVIACIDGEFTVKELQLRPSPQLKPHNPAYSPIEINPDEELMIFGVVTGVVRDLYRGR